MRQCGLPYARHSSDLRSTSSTEDQIATSKERIAKEGWTLDGTFVDEGISGANVLRPGYQSLLQVPRSAVCVAANDPPLARSPCPKTHGRLVDRGYFSPVPPTGAA